MISTNFSVKFSSETS